MKTKLYREISNAISNQSAELELSQSITPEDIRNAIRWVMRDNPDIFWFAHQYQFDEAKSTIYFQYTFSSEKVEEIQQSISDVIEKDFCIDYVKTLTHEEQIAYVYKWLVTYCNYNANSAYNQCMYSVFVRKNSVCTGYAKAAQYIFNLLGIDSLLVFGRLHNDNENGRHCWNLVKVENQYYHFDACFGDSILDNVAIKSGVQELFKVDGINYNFLCVSTDEILKTRTIEDITSLPESTASWSATLVESLAKMEIKQRKGIMGCLLSNIGSSADIYQCSQDKNTVLKVFRQESKAISLEEYHYMRQTKGCQHILQCNEDFTDITQNIIAIEQSTPIVDLLCSHYYELSLKGLIKMTIDVAKAWLECQKRGVQYRDIHVCNIYRSNNGTFKLGDFGSCTNEFDIEEVVGNQWFMAPETLASGIFTEASAIYSISMVMYFILNNLRPAFWAQGREDEALQKRMNGNELPTPIGCIKLPYNITMELDNFFRVASASLPNERFSSVAELIGELEKLTDSCKDCDYIIHPKGANSFFNFNFGELKTQEKCISGSDLSVDEIEKFATTMASHPNIPTMKSRSSPSVARDFELPKATYSPNVPVPENTAESKSIFGRIFGAICGRKQAKNIDTIKNEPYEVYSSIFAPAEVKRKSHLLVQVYLHLSEEAETVKSLAKESDKNAERRDYIPLSLKLKKGDRVDVEVNVYGETRLMSERKSIIWSGSYTKCSYDYFVPKDIDVDELSCEANLFVNGAMIGEMRFITQIVDAPRELNTEILSHRFNRIFISYAHQDVQQIKLLALAYRAQGIDYFYDRDSLAPGDVYEERIFDYIDSSDLFVLCWSKNAAGSDYVAKEKGRAMLRAYPQLSQKEATLKICPISIEPRADLPNDMKEIYNFEVI